MLIMARCRGYKICIDMGCFYTGRTCLFNIDTFEAFYFEDSKMREVIYEKHSRSN